MLKATYSCAKWAANITPTCMGTHHVPWSLLDDLLVPPLNEALSLVEVHVDLEMYDDSHSPYSLYGYMC